MVRVAGRGPLSALVRRRLARALLAALLVAPAAARAQDVDPGGRWRTLRTEHFDVHFDAALEGLARRAAAGAESAYAGLARELVPPRGRVELVISDDVDYTNGFASVVPANRIVLYANPPLNVPSLRFYDDWMTLVVTHELTHIFHLDRSRGAWRAAQRVFGRNPWLFPNNYAPAWVTEGLATYYESRLTTAGRVKGTHERMVVEASAAEHDFPRLGEISLATSRYPGGEIAYAYGALFFEWLADGRGSGAVPRFVEHASRELVPFRLGHLSRASFGISFRRAWDEWRDSLARATSGRAAAPAPEWRDLTREGRAAYFPRWRGDSALVFAASPGKEVAGLYEAPLHGRPRRLGRVNSLDAHAARADGSLVLAQLELVDPYRVRSDLYVQRGGEQRRLTRGARLVAPDVRADGWIVAVRLGGGTNQLVRVSPDGRRVLPVSPFAPDTQWAEPRWSPAGDRIAVTRWRRGGFADVVVLDTLGALVAEVTRDRAFDSSPSWLPDGSGIVFTSDRGGIANVYLARLGENHDGGIVALSDAAAGLFFPAVSPDGSRLAAARFGADGWHIGVAPMPAGEVASIAATPDTTPPAPAESAAGETRAYSPWRGLMPTGWSPIVEDAAAGHAAFGAEVSGHDAVGRHAYAARGLLDPRGEDHEWSASWSYRRLRQPVVRLGAAQEWTRGAIVDTAGERVGALRRRARTVGLSFGFSRPRWRSGASASVGGEIESRGYVTDPEPLLDALDPFYASEPQYRALVASAGWSNLQFPALSISPEDGVSLAASARWRWLRGEGGMRSRSVTAVAGMFQGFDLGGFAHHVVAARIAAGYADGRAPMEFSVGGTSGSPATILPGITVGERRTFGVRGFPAGARAGRRALTGTLEYRAPLVPLLRGVPHLPLFLDRTSLAIFGDAGTADDGNLGASLGADAWLASVGAEVKVEAALQYDLPALLRFGVAVPVVDHSLIPTRAVSVYARLGASF